MQKGCILTCLGFSIWRESRVALATAICGSSCPLLSLGSSRSDTSSTQHASYSHSRKNERLARSLDTPTGSTSFKPWVFIFYKSQILGRLIGYCCTLNSDIGRHLL